MKHAATLSLLLTFCVWLAACGPAGATSTRRPSAITPSPNPAAEQERTVAPPENPALASIPPNSLVDLAASDSRLSMWATAMETSGLVETFAISGPFTILAPTDEAFTALPEGVWERMMGEPDGLLTNVLVYHILEGARDTESLLALSTVNTLLDQNLTVGVRNGSIIFNDQARIVDGNMRATNGVIHVIDAVLLPPGWGR
ncbi:MAG: fasciclin domain-containing protein [Chloroflexi bacterium]|nr:fasciclin domain-containing protein [Chloroflexota bacterium]MCI0577471.1 fasciclin domain-containing protein [Chloroflexota bacterium]MCI0647662.1 fasciclin domain-containing protein [Chloroflexota bacterium]MCI0730092.1 fasciclin domain-containing protein [Chloroflexota bacterium]